MKVNNEESIRIQIVRGLAIFAVILIHNTPAGLPQVFIRPFINFAVGVFIFLSGMLSDANRWNPVKRILKLLIPYAIWTLVYVILKEYSSPSHIPLQYVKDFVKGTGSAVMYYVFVYIELTLLIPLIDRLARSKFRFLGYLISPIDIILFNLIPLIFGIELNKYFSIIRHISCLNWFIFFYFGYNLGNGIIKMNIGKIHLVLLYVVSILIQIAEGYLYYSYGNTNPGSQGKISSVISGVIFCCFVFDYIINGNKDGLLYSILHKIGNASFGIFFSHIFIMTILDSIPIYSKLDIIPVNAIIVLAISYFLTVLIGKILKDKSKYLAM